MRPSPILLMLVALADGAVRADTLRIEPARLHLDGPDATAQARALLGPADLTDRSDLVWRSERPEVVRVTPGGQLAAMGDGATELVVTLGGLAARSTVIVSGTDPRRPVDFEADVVPVLTRHGCNAGACHGKSSGQNGFRLSLLGDDPSADFESLTREGRGRRVIPAAPILSLLLRKPTAAIPHGGGRRLTRESPGYRTLERWIRQGAPGPVSQGSGASGSLRILPADGALRPRESRQLRVLFREDGGPERDVTLLALFDRLGSDSSSVTKWGRLTAGDRPGEAIVAARYRGRVAVARYPVREAVSPVASRHAEATGVIDREIEAKLADLGLAPASLCTDAEFARRSALDLAGVLPDPTEVAAFVASDAHGKRVDWIDRWLERPEHVDRLAWTWSGLLGNRRTLGEPSMPGTFAFHDWLRRAFAENRPLDRLAEDLLTAVGPPDENPAVVWYRNYPNAETLSVAVGSLFLGVRLECARCHRHPFDRWAPDDFRGFSAYFERVGRKPSSDPASPAVFVLPGPPTLSPRRLGGPTLTRQSEREDPRRDLVEWLRDPENPFFARALVNRVWKQYLGRGLVEPEDDFRLTNPPSHPRLLEELAAEFVRTGYDLRRLIRSIVNSRAYQRSSIPATTDGEDPSTYARYLTRRLPGPVLLDALDRVAGVSTDFPGVPRGLRAGQLPDDGFDTPGGFLRTFGRGARGADCACESVAVPDLGQSLYFLNGAEIQARVARDEGRAARYARDDEPDRDRIEALYRVAFSRPPTVEERRVGLDLLARRRAEGRLRAGFEDLIWAILNTPEFQFNH